MGGKDENNRGVAGEGDPGGALLEDAVLAVGLVLAFAELQ